MLAGTALWAQDTVWHRYNSGEPACLEVFEGPDAYGRTESGVWVYRKTGTLVFRGVRRNYAGHASVDLVYHSNGGVARIEASSAPDAGIQWYRERMDLDEEGNVVYHQKQSHEAGTRHGVSLLRGPLMIRADRHPLPLESLKIEVRDHRRGVWRTTDPDEWALRTRPTPTGMRYELYWVD